MRAVGIINNIISYMYGDIGEFDLSNSIVF